MSFYSFIVLGPEYVNIQGFFCTFAKIFKAFSGNVYGTFHTF